MAAPSLQEGIDRAGSPVRLSVAPAPYDWFARTCYREAAGGGPLASAQRRDI